MGLWMLFLALVVMGCLIGDRVDEVVESGWCEDAKRGGAAAHGDAATAPDEVLRAGASEIAVVTGAVASKLGATGTVEERVGTTTAGAEASRGQSARRDARVSTYGGNSGAGVAAGGTD